MHAPIEIRTSRLLLRPWNADDAEHLLPVLEANRSHLGPWIPARVAEPAPLAVLAERLTAFAADFGADREWRYALVSLNDGRLLGEVSLFPRSAEARVPYSAADRAEIGYWLRADATGTGLASEAAHAMVDLAMTMPALGHVEIRCDARNGASAAVPRRLGFELSDSRSDAGVSRDAAAPVTLQVWTRRLVEHNPSRPQVGGTTATMRHMDPASIRAYAARDWEAIGAAKRVYWASRFQREGPGATVEASRALLAEIRHVRPDYPTAHERRADLAGHVRLRMLLDRAAHAFACR